MSEEIKDSVQTEEQTPSVDYEALYKEQLALAEKWKKVADKNASEASDFKKKYNATLSEQDRLNSEKAEREAEHDAMVKQLIRENTINKLEKSYLAMNYTQEEASKMANAEADGDLEAKLKIMAEVKAREKKEMEQEFRRSIPQPNFGVGNEAPAMTKEDTSKAGYLALKELKDKYPETYKKFMK